MFFLYYNTYDYVHSTVFLTIILPSVDSRREGGDFTFIYFTSAYDHIKNMLRIFKAGFSGNFKNTEPRPKFPYSYKKKACNTLTVNP